MPLRTNPCERSSGDRGSRSYEPLGALRSALLAGHRRRFGNPRRWKRPTVKAGGRLRSPVGELAIQSVDVIDDASISEDDARRAGFTSREDLLRELGAREGTLYRIAFHLSGPDTRIALREQADLSTEDVHAIAERLARMDRGAPWTLRTLRLIEERPGTRAADLASIMGSETLAFKLRVRKLKELGLTESLEVGYRLSPRGNAVLEHLAIERSDRR